MAKIHKCIIGGKEEQVIDYKRKKYCHSCFEENFDQEIVDKHYCYITFQNIFNRKPTDAEWTQMNKMVKGNTESSTSWTWAKIEYALQYVYEVEKLEVSEEYGVIGILPYYETKMMKFRNECFGVEDDVDEFGFGMGEEETVYIIPPKKENNNKRKSVDELIDWEEVED